MRRVIAALTLEGVRHAKRAVQDVRRAILCEIRFVVFLGGIVSFATWGRLSVAERDGLYRFEFALKVINEFGDVAVIGFPHRVD